MEIERNDRSYVEQVVMRRVRIIRILRLVLSFDVLAMLALVAALWGIGREVWVARVFENAPKDLPALPRFYVAAFEHTRLIVQALSLITLVSLIYLARESARGAVRFLRSPLSSPKALP